METLKKTTIGYKNARVELSKMKSGRYYISNGCEPLGFADTYLEACEIYQKKVKAFRAKRTRALNKDIKFVIENWDSVDFDLVKENFKKDYCLPEDTTRWIFETRTGKKIE